MTYKIGEVVVIVEEDPAICEQCGKKKELRSYGKRLGSGRRMRVCFDCMRLDEEEGVKAFLELIDGCEVKKLG